MRTVFLWLGLGFFAVGFIAMTGLYLLEIGGNDGHAQAPANSTMSTTESASAHQSFISDAPESAPVEVVPVSYQADVGKFKLDLDQFYSIIVHLDGDFEGGPSTKLEVGRKVNGTEGVFSAYLNDYVKIEAYPSSTHGGRDQFVNTDTVLGAASAIEEPASIDGVQARKFTVNTLGRTEKIYFENNGVTYLIEAWDTANGGTQDTLNDVIRGFSFVQ